MSTNDPQTKCVECGAMFWPHHNDYRPHCPECWAKKSRAERRRIEREQHRAFEAAMKRMESRK